MHRRGFVEGGGGVGGGGGWDGANYHLSMNDFLISNFFSGRSQLTLGSR